MRKPSGEYTQTDKPVKQTINNTEYTTYLSSFATIANGFLIW